MSDDSFSSRKRIISEICYKSERGVKNVYSRNTGGGEFIIYGSVRLGGIGEGEGILLPISLNRISGFLAGNTY